MLPLLLVCLPLSSSPAHEPVTVTHDFARLHPARHEGRLVRVRFAVETTGRAHGLPIAEAESADMSMRTVYFAKGQENAEVDERLAVEGLLDVIDQPATRLADGTYLPGFREVRIEDAVRVRE